VRGIGWHRDRPAFEHVIGFLLGAAVVIRFRRRRDENFERVNMPPEPGDAYHLSGMHNRAG
jgi:DNA oxidative demethylase